MVGELVELMLRHTTGDEMRAYERLLGDAIEGDPTLFVREDEVLAAWAIVEPALRAPSPVHEYEPGTWGPPEGGRPDRARRRMGQPDRRRTRSGARRTK